MRPVQWLSHVRRSRSSLAEFMNSSDVTPQEALAEQRLARRRRSRTSRRTDLRMIRPAPAIRDGHVAPATAASGRCSRRRASRGARQASLEVRCGGSSRQGNRALGADTLAGFPCLTVVAGVRYPARLLEHSRQMHAVPGHDGRVSLREVIGEADTSAAFLFVAIRGPGARLTDPSAIGLGRRGVSEVVPGEARSSWRCA